MDAGADYATSHGGCCSSASLYFTRPFGAPDPLPQLLASAINGANFGFTSRPLAPRHPARFRRHPPGLVAARHVALPYFSGRSGGSPLFDDSLQRLQRLRQQHRSWSVRRRRSICGYRKYRTKLRTWSLRLVRQLFRLALSALHMLATDASAAFKSPHNPPRASRRWAARVLDRLVIFLGCRPLGSYPLGRVVAMSPI